MEILFYDNPLTIMFDCTDCAWSVKGIGENRAEYERMVVLTATAARFHVCPVLGSPVSQ